MKRIHFIPRDLAGAPKVKVKLAVHGVTRVQCPLPLQLPPGSPNLLDYAVELALEGPSALRKTVILASILVGQIIQALLPKQAATSHLSGNDERIPILWHTPDP
ncbi:hypothetical protein GE061_002404 [Apolygus lucorum]|uniref:Uncharacterized protein n=1 Tax=Apolygus lucorum TaxID=248454 RepID=A0A8S9X6D9_APOLU|nr:hypothetical protein GE061_002404 [Apolygus lucorum]